MSEKVKFIDEMHEGTDDGFEIEKDYKGRLFVNVYQEFNTGVVRKIYLSEGDIRQIYAKLEEI